MRGQITLKFLTTTYLYGVEVPEKEKRGEREMGRERDPKNVTRTTN